MGVIVMIFGLIFFIPSIKLGIIADSSTGIPGPGAGFFPFITSAFVIFFALWVIFKSVKQGSVDYFGDDPEQLVNIKIVFLEGAAFIIFMFIWRFVSFFAGIFLICLFLNWLFGRTWKFNIIFSVVFTALLYVVFEQLLYIQFDA